MMVPHQRVKALSALAFALGAVLLSATPAAAFITSIQVNPDTVQAGYVVSVDASCPDNSRSATVVSEAFGTVTVQPQKGHLTAEALVPETTPAGTYKVKLECGGLNTATDLLTVVSGVRANRGPATGFGGTANTGGERLLITAGIATLVAGAAVGLFTMRRRADTDDSRVRSRR